MFTQLLNTLLPHRCFSCEEIVPRDGGLCASCWAQVHFITPPYCAQCGHPLEVNLGEEAICAACAKQEHIFNKVRSLIVYNDLSKHLILKFKHGDAQHSAPLFGRWMAQMGQDLLKTADVMAPVPLHWTRLLKRTYNQSQLLAKAIRPYAEAAYKPALLKRIRPTPTQGHLTRTQRQTNVKGSIRVDERHKSLIKGKHILLIDDVMTSGATLNVCAKALLSEGASTVDAMTLGRVTRN